jgi:hypothetical protein
MAVNAAVREEDDEIPRSVAGRTPRPKDMEQMRDIDRNSCRPRV